MPKIQNYSNHRHYVPLYHFITVPLMGFVWVAAIFLLSDQKAGPLLLRVLVLMLATLLMMVAFCARLFALRAQDRAIRAEETLRYFILTGKRFPENITQEQIFALRFAKDDEFLALVDQAAREGLTNKEIKLRIRNWRPDHHRA